MEIIKQEIFKRASPNLCSSQPDIEDKFYKNFGWKNSAWILALNFDLGLSYFHGLSREFSQLIKNWFNHFCGLRQRSTKWTKYNLKVGCIFPSRPSKTGNLAPNPGGWSYYQQRVVVCLLPPWLDARLGVLFQTK